MPYEWKPQQGEIARRIYPKDVSGVFKKEIIASEYQRVFMIQDGTIKEILSQGKHDVGGLLVRDRSAVYVDFSDKDLLYGFSDLKLIDGVAIKCHGELRFRIHDPQLFYVNLLASRDLLTLDDLWTRLKLELQNILSTALYQHRAKELYGNPEVRSSCYNAVDMEMRKTLLRWGLEVIQFTLNPIFPPEWAALEKEKMEMTIEKEKMEMRKDDKEKTNKCPQCNADLPDKATFCPACGSRVGGRAG